MTIHGSHPFETAPQDRDPLRRFRGRLASGVTLWTSGTGVDRAGLTVSSLMLAAGEPARVLALLDPDSHLAEQLQETGTASVHVLAWPQRQLAEMFAGTTPAAGGAFTHAAFEDTSWGPALVGAPARIGVRLEAEREVGWSLEVTCVVEDTVVGEPPTTDEPADDEPLVHHRGRWRRVVTQA